LLFTRFFNPEAIATYQDMVKMPVLNEPEILNNTFVRFRRDEIYSYIGTTITFTQGPTLLCMNPYKQLTKIFDQSAITRV
jgi:myosin heavy subunit